MRHQGGKEWIYKLVKMSEKFKPQLLDMMDEWTKTGETIIPWAIRKSIIMILMLI